MRVQLDCTPNGDSVELTGLVDGVEQISVVDADGLGTFKSGAVEFYSEHSGDSVRFDNVRAVVPGE